MELTWKDNWPETRQHYRDWWNHKSFIISHWGSGLDTGKSLYDIPEVPETADPVQRHTDASWIIPHEEYTLSRNWQGADFMPIAFPDYGTVTLATFLGTEPRYEEEYVLYKHSDLTPENDYPLTLDKKNSHYQFMLNLSKGLKERSQGRFTVGTPAFMPGLDVLAELRGTNELLMDLVLNPDWVKAKMEEINQVYFEAYEDFYKALSWEDGSINTGYFMVWGPGKTAFSQCDFSAMISPDMFEEFELPWLTQHCDYMDNIIYHLDGPDAVNKLDHLLQVKNLDAIQWTPGPQLPQGGDPQWYDMYKKIKAAGKSVQAPWVKPEEVVPLLDSVGPEGLYIMVDFKTRQEVEDVLKKVEPYR